MLNSLLTAKSSSDRTKVEEIYAAFNALSVTDVKSSLLASHKLFVYIDSNTGINSSTPLALVIATQARPVAVALDFRSTGKWDLEIYEDTVVSDLGQILPALDLNRVSPATPNFVVGKDPAIIANGTRLLIETVFADTRNSSSSFDPSNPGMILKPNSVYMILITRVDTGSADADIVISAAEASV